MAKFLTVTPSDLTQLAKKNRRQIFCSGRSTASLMAGKQVRGHGTREMPIWGARFQAEARGTDPGSRSQVAGRILGLVFYLHHIQE